MTKPTRGGDADVAAILTRYKCPTPFHEVRTRFLGAIATPVLGASPIDVVKQLWGGEFPAFDSLDAANELLNVLVAGLWNRLTEHQSGADPFRLLHLDVDVTRDGLKQLARVRQQEVDGFVEGLFGVHDHIDLPGTAHTAIGVLAEMRAMLAGAIHLLDDSSKPASHSELCKLMENIRQMTMIAETEINNAVVSCARARIHALELMVAAKPTLH